MNRAATQPGKFRGPAKWTTAEWVVGVIAGVTVGSGVIQALFPKDALTRLGVPVTPEATALLSLLGVFTALFGILLGHALLLPEGRRTVLPWIAVQKAVGATAALVTVRSGIADGTALWGAGFDAAAALCVGWLWMGTLRRVTGRRTLLTGIVFVMSLTGCFTQWGRTAGRGAVEGGLEQMQTEKGRRALRTAVETVGIYARGTFEERIAPGVDSAWRKLAARGDSTIGRAERSLLRAEDSLAARLEERLSRAVDSLIERGIRTAGAVRREGSCCSPPAGSRPRWKPISPPP